MQVERFMARDATDVEQCVRRAISSSQQLEIVGTSTRRALGGPVTADVILDLSLLSGVVLYEPEELVLIVRPGTLLAEVEDALAQRRQHLPFQPPDFSRLWAVQHSGTIGGAIMTGRSGSRRLTVGAARDYVLGLKGVNGYGECFAAGGRVVKNVTGFDICKLVTGSFGTLCAVTELILKVMPMPSRSESVAIFGLEVDSALKLIRQVLNETTLSATSVAYLPANVVATGPSPLLSERGTSVTLFRFEGFDAAVAHGVFNLQNMVDVDFQTSTIVNGEEQAVWRAISGAEFFGYSNRPIWHLSLPPSHAFGLSHRLLVMKSVRWYLDWAGGGCWIEGGDSENEESVRDVLTTVALGDGHATLMRASEVTRKCIAPFQPQDSAVTALAERVRRQFDPHNIFNPGKFSARVDAN